MTDHSVKHSTFTLERSYAASPATVFAAWSDRATPSPTSPSDTCWPAATALPET